MKTYQDLLQHILDNGTEKKDRTGIGTYSVSGATLRFDLSKGFPLVTTKRTAFRLIITELLWFLRGDTNLRYLLENKNFIWVEWPLKNWIESADFKTVFPDIDMTDYTTRIATDTELNEKYQEIYQYFCDRILSDDAFSEKWGDCGRAYGAQWRKAYYVNPENLAVSEVDQLGEALNLLKHNPESRRIIVSSFNQDNVKHAVLPCCHHQFQFIERGEYLDLIFDMRSSDVFTGLPFNIAQYAALLLVFCKMLGYTPGELIYHGKDVHIYKNQLDQVHAQLNREPYPLPTLTIKTKRSRLEDYELADFELENYQHHPSLRAPIAI